MITNFVPDARPRRSIPFVDGADDEGPEERRDDAADAAEEARAADHGGGDDEQQQLASTRVRRDRAEPRGEHDAADAGHEAADHEDGDAHTVDVDPGPPRRLGVPAHRVDVAAEARSRGDERPEDQEDDEDQDRVGHAAILVAVPDGGERDEREPGDLEHDQREGLPVEPAGAPLARGVELRERVGEHRHGSHDPARRLREEVVRDADDGLVLDPDRPTSEAWVVRIRTTPDQMRRPARVTTKDGTPALVITSAWTKPIAVVTRRAARIASHQGHPGSSGRRSSVITTPPTALTKATERSISPIRSTKTTPMAIVAIAAICRRRFVKLRSVREGVVEEAEDDDDDHEPDDDRKRPSSPALTPCHQRWAKPDKVSGERLALGRRGGRRLLDVRGDRGRILGSTCSVTRPLLPRRLPCRERGRACRR